MKRLIGFLILVAALGVVRQAGAAELTDTCYQPELRGEQYAPIPPAHSAMCASTAEPLRHSIEAENHSCAAVVYWSAKDGYHRDIVRVTCRLYDGGFAYYESDTGGPWKLTGEI